MGSAHWGRGEKCSGRLGAWSSRKSTAMGVGLLVDFPVMPSSTGEFIGGRGLLHGAGRIHYGGGIEDGEPIEHGAATLFRSGCHRYDLVAVAQGSSSPQDVDDSDEDEEKNWNAAVLYAKDRCHRLKSLLPLRAVLEASVVGFAEGVGVIFLSTETGFFTVQLNSGQKDVLLKSPALHELIHWW